jgi:SPP1 family holin
MTGHSVLPITDAGLELFITNGFTFVMAVISWWKNNSFTKKAIEADKILKESK